MREAARRRERALRSIQLLRIVESDESLGCWAPEPWHKEEAGKGKPAKRAWEVPAGCEEMPVALGRAPPAVVGPRVVVTITKRQRGASLVTWCRGSPALGAKRRRSWNEGRLP